MITRVLASCAAALLAHAALAQTGPTFSFQERAGPHGVGLKVMEQQDRSRTYGFSTDELGQPYPSERTRPLQILTWYPAAPTDRPPMTVADYLNLWKTEIDFTNTMLPARAREWRAGLQSTLNTPLWARRDAPPLSGHFPVVIYAPSYSSVAWENADLCEYLASHGYVVLATASFGARARLMTTDLEGLRAQARDIAFLMTYAQTLPHTDTARIAAIGFSWGGLTSLVAAAQDPRIDALIALDGSQRYYPALVKEAGVHPEEMSIPFLYFAQDEYSLEDQARYTSAAQHEGPNVLNAWTHGDLTRVHMLALQHGQFSAMFLRNEESWRNYFLDAQQARGDYGPGDSIESYAWVARYTLQFLNAYLKNNAAAKEYLKRRPTENGVRKHFMAITHRPASGPPASFENFRREIGRRGFDHAADLYSELRKQKSEFTLDEVQLEAWTEELLDGERFAEAIALLKLSVQLHPDSSGAHTSLARAYELSGQKSPALKSYERALQLSPLDVYVKKRLEALLDKPLR